MANLALDSQFIFSPERQIISTPAAVGLEYEDVFFSAQDGVTLHGWFVPGASDLTILWLHGNAGNISHRVDNLRLLNQKLGINVFIFDYRGYGQSEGTPSETGTYLDAEAATDYLRSRLDDPRLRVFGRSLGAAIAVETARRRRVDAVILESPFTSVEAMNRRAHPVLSSFIPVGAIVQSRYDSLSKIGEVTCPILVMHGDQDVVVAFDMGKELFDAANEPKQFYTIEGAGHSDTYTVGGKAYFDAMARFLENPTGD